MKKSNDFLDEMLDDLAQELAKKIQKLPVKDQKDVFFSMSTDLAEEVLRLQKELGELQERLLEQEDISTPDPYEDPPEVENNDPGCSCESCQCQDDKDISQCGIDCDCDESQREACKEYYENKNLENDTYYDEDVKNIFSKEDVEKVAPQSSEELYKETEEAYKKQTKVEKKRRKLWKRDHKAWQAAMNQWLDEINSSPEWSATVSENKTPKTLEDYASPKTHGYLSNEDIVEILLRSEKKKVSNQTRDDIDTLCIEIDRLNGLLEKKTNEYDNLWENIDSLNHKINQLLWDTLAPRNSEPKDLPEYQGVMHGGHSV